jgi:hypothetical protein
MNEGIETVYKYLRDYKNWSERNEDSNSFMSGILRRIKADAVRQYDQETAKATWCLEKILEIQNYYLTAFTQLKSEKFYEGWCTLERIEIQLNSLERHHKISIDDEYKLQLIKKHVEQFQSLFPYKLFSSPAFLHLEQKCMICGRIVSIRHPCGHRLGEIYNGEECVHEITKMKVLEISIVSNPVQKYSVLFPKSSDSEEETDTYDYSLLKYLMKGLRDPFDAWELRWTKIRHSHSSYAHVNKNEKCPCGSGKSYKSCCLRTSGVLRPHVDFLFHVPPPDDLPRISYPQIVPRR